MISKDYKDYRKKDPKSSVDIAINLLLASLIFGAVVFGLTKCSNTFEQVIF